MASNPFGSITLPTQLFLSFALGHAASPAIEPYAQTLANDAWKLHAVVPPPAVLLAAGVAQGQVAKADAYNWAKEQGFDTAQMDALVAIANVGMPLGMAFQAIRRDKLTDQQLRTQFNRAGIESAWFDALDDLQHDKLDLGAIATAVHRGIMSDAGLLVTPVPSGSGHVPRIPQSPLDTLAEFKAQGIDPERARVLVADTGLPLSLGEMLQLYNRNKVTATDVKVSVAESNIRNEYMDVALDLARRLLTPREWAEADLRGVETHANASQFAQESGLTAADYETLFETVGRPLNIHQIVTGEARGGTYGGGYDTVPAGPYRDAIRRSAIRPEYADLAYHNRYTYPSAFVLRSLAQAGDLGNTAAVSQTLQEIGWKPSFADQVAAAWTGGGGADPHVAKAETRLWTTMQTSYISGEAVAADLAPGFNALGVPAAAQTQIRSLWDEARALERKQLTPTQIKKAVKEGVVNPATGQPWTHDEAVARLISMGYSANDATTFLSL